MKHKRKHKTREWNPNISILILNLNDLNIPVKTWEWWSLLKVINQQYMLSARKLLQIQWHRYAGWERLEKTCQTYDLSKVVTVLQ